MAKTARGRKTPWPAALLPFAATCAFLPLGKVESIASVAALGVLIAFTGVHAAAIALRLRSHGPRPEFSIPFTIGRMPVPAVLGLVANSLLMSQFAPDVYGLVALTLGPGFLGYPLLHRRRI